MPSWSTRRGRSTDDVVVEDDETEEEESWGLGKGMQLREVSAKDDRGIQNLFDVIIKEIIKRKDVLERDRIAKERDSIRKRQLCRAKAAGAAALCEPLPSDAARPQHGGGGRGGRRVATVDVGARPREVGEPSDDEFYLDGGNRQCEAELWDSEVYHFGSTYDGNGSALEIMARRNSITPAACQLTHLISGSGDRAHVIGR
ncbi:hypothetical protein AG1IA_04342 [Rhizoctonia solani AG-1 IA]|uniref:Uncharacterized protein n=1 Tax=Thanatephorus cucumeris (strain AG1-IA) TaxID=983506 RepID=L8WXR9_THACA|nr:hypothetical protein AG1IA_04342 [Rhizoctonia solani AG-1 IA]